MSRDKTLKPGRRARIEGIRSQSRPAWTGYLCLIASEKLVEVVESKALKTAVLHLAHQTLNQLDPEATRR